MRHRKLASHSIHSLKDLRPGQSGVVSYLAVHGGLKRRLIDMGVTPGVRVYLRKEAPMGDPIEINVRDYNLSIRKKDAKDIMIHFEEENL